MPWKQVYTNDPAKGNDCGFRKLEDVDVDLWGPHQPALFGGKHYAAVLIDGKTRKSWVIFIRSKDEFVEIFQLWLPEVENQSKCTMQNLRAEGGREIISAKLKTFCEGKGIPIKYVAPYMHEENGIAERSWRTIATMKDSLLIDSGLPVEFWADAMDTANYLRNRLPTRCQHGELILEEAWTEQPQDLSHLRIFGSLANVGIPKETRFKSDIKKTWKGIFVGYSLDTSKHYRVYAPQTRQLVIADAPSISEADQGAKLLVQFPLEPSMAVAKRKTPAAEPRPRGRPKIPISNNLEASTLTSEQTNPTMQVPTTTTETVNPATEIAMPAADTGSNVYEPGGSCSRSHLW